MLNTKKEKSVTFLIKKIISDKYFLLSLCICLIEFGVFNRINYAPDTYWDIMNDGGHVASNAFLPSGRFITALFAICLKGLNMHPYAIYAISYLAAILFAALSIYLLKTRILDVLIKKHPLSFVLSTIIVVNPLSIELFVYYEKGIMLLSVLLSILGAISFGRYCKSENKKYLIYSLLLAFLSTCCYQGTLGLYIVLMTLINVSTNKRLSSFIKNSIISVCLYAIAPICNIILTKLLSKGGRIGGDIHLLDSLMVLSQNFQNLIRMFGIIPVKYIYIIVALTIVVSSVWLIAKKKKTIKEVLLVYAKMGFIIAVTIMASLAPQLLINIDSIWVVPRSTYVFGSIVGVLTCVYCSSLQSYKYTKAHYLPLLYSALMLVMQFYSFNNIGVNNYIVSNIDKQRAIEVANIITEHEITSGMSIKSIAVYYDSAPEMSYDGLKTYGDINAPAFSILWANVDLINYWTDSHYERVFSPEYENKCLEQNNASSDGDSVQFDNSTAIICLY